MKSFIGMGEEERNAFLNDLSRKVEMGLPKGPSRNSRSLFVLLIETKPGVWTRLTNTTTAGVEKALASQIKKTKKVKG